MMDEAKAAFIRVLEDDPNHFEALSALKKLAQTD